MIMSRASAAEAVVRALEQEGVRHLFIGPPGEHVVELYDSILDSRQIRGILATNEYTLSFMADGYSRVTGEVGVFTCVPGPGVTNALTGITEAFTDSSPVVGIVSDVRSRIEEGFQLHQIPHPPVLEPVTKGFFRVDDPADTDGAIHEAFCLARSGEPGPVIVEIPCDVYPMHAPMREREMRKGEPSVDRGAVRKIAGLLKDSKKCGIYIGRGCFHAGEEVKKLSEILQAPVASSVSGRGILPEDDPLSVGFGFGSNGSPVAREVFEECDAVLAVGCKFGEVSSGSYSFKIPKNFIHVDINPENLNKVFKTDWTLVSDAAVFFKALLEELKGFVSPEDAVLKEKIRKGKERFFQDLAGGPENLEAVDPGKFYGALRESMDRRDTLTVDIGNHELWAISGFPVLASGTFLCPTNFSAMGFAIPAAIAAQLARPDRRAIACVGDGGFLMSGFEILTAVRHRLPVAFFVFNDGAFGITKGLQERIFKRTAFVDLQNPGYAPFAESFGLAYLRIDRDRDIRPVLEKVRELRQPLLVEVKVDYGKMSPFLKGIVRRRVWTTPWKEKLHVARRWVKRTIFPEGDT
jgi:acetolactate synthase I/II/III large subunit